MTSHKKYDVENLVHGAFDMESMQVRSLSRAL